MKILFAGVRCSLGNP
jgi:hypothetical protein